MLDSHTTFRPNTLKPSFFFFCFPQALQSVFDLDFRHGLPPFLLLSGHCIFCSFCTVWFCILSTSSYYHSRRDSVNFSISLSVVVYSSSPCLFLFSIVLLFFFLLFHTFSLQSSKQIFWAHYFCRANCPSLWSIGQYGLPQCSAAIYPEHLRYFTASYSSWLGIDVELIQEDLIP